MGYNKLPSATFYTWWRKIIGRNKLMDLEDIVEVLRSDIDYLSEKYTRTHSRLLKRIEALERRRPVIDKEKLLMQEKARQLAGERKIVAEEMKAKSNRESTRSAAELVRTAAEKLARKRARRKWEADHRL